MDSEELRALATSPFCGAFSHFISSLILLRDAPVLSPSPGCTTQCCLPCKMLLANEALNTIVPGQSNFGGHAGFFLKHQCCRSAATAFSTHFSVLELDSTLTFCKAVFESVDSLILL